MSEKIETVITRGDQNTRPRDYYDIYVVHKLQGQNIDYTSLSEALKATASKRNSIEIINNYKDILETIHNSEEMKKRWKNYQKDFDYATDIDYADTVEAVNEIMGEVIE